MADDKGRFIGFDIARALAVFGMVVVNFKVVTDPRAWRRRPVEHGPVMGVESPRADANRGMTWALSDAQVRPFRPHRSGTDRSPAPPRPLNR